MNSDNLKKQRRELIKSLIAEADKKIEGGYSEFSSKFAPSYVKLGVQLSSLDASVTLRAIECMEPDQAKEFVENKQPLKVNGKGVEVAYLEMALNAVSYMNTEQAKKFIHNHPNDLEIISDEDYAFRKGVCKPSLGNNSSFDIVYSDLLIVAMRHKDLSLNVGRKWIRNGLSLSGHSLDVGKSMKIIAKDHLGLSEKEAARYELFGLLHDTGKLEVESEYLGSGNKLDRKGWDSMKQHPSKGQEIIETLARYAGTEYSQMTLTEAAKTARWHHENFDGSGYPDKISGENIPLAARVLRIADFWNARTAHRSYSLPMPTEVAVEEGKRCSGQDYNESVLKDYQEKIDPKYDRWKRGRELEFDPEICYKGQVFEVLAKKVA